MPIDVDGPLVDGIDDDHSARCDSDSHGYDHERVEQKLTTETLPDQMLMPCKPSNEICGNDFTPDRSKCPMAFRGPDGTCEIAPQLTGSAIRVNPWLPLFDLSVQ